MKFGALCCSCGSLGRLAGAVRGSGARWGAVPVGTGGGGEVQQEFWGT